MLRHAAAAAARHLLWHLLAGQGLADETCLGAVGGTTPVHCCCLYEAHMWTAPATKLWKGNLWYCWLVHIRQQQDLLLTEPLLRSMLEVACVLNVCKWQVAQCSAQSHSVHTEVQLPLLLVQVQQCCLQLPQRVIGSCLHGYSLLLAATAALNAYAYAVKSPSGRFHERQSYLLPSTPEPGQCTS